MNFIIEAAEEARAAGTDVEFSYGSASNPNGTTAVSSRVGLINGPLFPALPGDVGPPDLNANLNAIPDSGIPCTLREEKVLTQWPQGVVVVKGDGSTMLITANNSAVDKNGMF
jgi:hypothetical protein